ncbi:magnesium and cobalt transport protein CorA [Janibacter limosus]|uniref:Magnesium and cobalt transport protein CorA n=1 Tax=Janibacter limosus TaxID=53458 RepID=A0A4P6MTJ3_9MICO|nr:magnesium and cobalt transport protein CorA [Janibacter limosus]QBF46082.1 magnesium and cobalt transport protein CorA [Janibacter limosus]
MIVDQARYSAGHRQPCEDIGQALEEIRASGSQDFLWIGMRDPSAETFDQVSGALGLHRLAVEDSVKGDQRPKIERYGDVHFVVLRPLRYVEATSDVESGEIMVFVGPDYIVTVRRGEASPLAGLRSRLEGHGHGSLRHGPWGVFHAIIDFVVDQYLEIEDELQSDLDDIESSVFSSGRTVDTGEIYALKREVLEFKRAALPLARPLSQLVGPTTPVPGEELRLLFRDVFDHLSLVNDNTESQDRLLSDVLSAHLAQVGVQQNQDMRKISAWAAMAALATMVAGVYGMNFEGMPELSLSVHVGDGELYYGYPLALLAMGSLCFVLYRLFKRSGWL